MSRTIVPMNERERACILQGFIAGLISGDTLSESDIDALSSFGLFAEHLLTDRPVSFENLSAFRRFFDDFIMPRTRSDLVIAEPDLSFHKHSA